MTTETKAQHTPGPWEVDDGEIRADAMSVGVVHQAADFPCADEEDEAKLQAECEANARLIAAAPDLLAACEAIAALADGQGRLNMLQVAGQARQAIAKAEGQAQ